MSKKYFIIFLSIALLFGCSKFDHQDLNVQQSCDLCDYADSLNGTYRGLVLNNELPAFVQLGDNYDSLTITVEHIFLNNDPYGDSLYMNFATSFAFDSIPDITYDTIQIRSASGQVHDSEFDTYNILLDSIIIYYSGQFYTGPTQSIQYTKILGTLYKE